jgi:radical SAM superfamily enzyme YgiQ (UPF0313 family)
MTKKVLFIRPGNVYNYNNYPPLNLILLATALKQKNIETEILNSALEPDILSIIQQKLPDTFLVAFTLLTSEVPDALKILKFIRKNSQVPIVVGGWHCTLFPDQMVANNLVDYVITGEGEEHIVELASNISKGIFPSEKIYQKKILDLNTLPEPDYSLDPFIERFITSYLTDTLSRYVHQPLRWLPYESSRGCPSQCTFCINVVTGNTRYRKKSAEKVISEIENIIKKYNISHIKFIDDNFFVDVERVRKICRGILERNMSITWDAECRCDYFNDRHLNDETLALARKSGLVQLTLGIESGSQRTLDIMKKNITVEQAECAVRMCNKHGIIARSAFILEIPGELKEDTMKTIHFINKMRQYPFFSCGVGTFRPYPKCELTEHLLKEGYLKEPTNLEEWTSPEVMNMYTAAEYVRPWQTDGKYSMRASYYLNMESAIRLGSHQMPKLSDRIKNNFFMGLAKIRNRLLIYSLPYDMLMYKKFLENFYQRQGEIDKGVVYPLSASKNENEDLKLE